MAGRNDLPCVTMEDRAEVSIVIPTFRRNPLLGTLLHALARQRGVENGACEITVVDNSPERHAADLVRRIASTIPFATRYVHEPRPGISHARNAGVHASMGRLIAFIDDDEQPEETWLAELLAAQRRFDADVVIGPVHPVFSAPPAPIVAESLTFDPGIETGTILALPFTRSRHGEPCYRRHPLASHNTLVKRDCFATDRPFDPSLGLTGGEDSLFFADLYFAGRKFVWCAEAGLREMVPVERATLSYVLGRAFRNGQITSATCLKLRRKRPWRLALWMGIGALQALAGAAMLVLPPGRRHKGARLLRGGLGKLLWMQRYRQKEYGEPSAASAPSAMRAVP